jgi:micrococcal nuclease
MMNTRTLLVSFILSFLSHSCNNSNRDIPRLISGKVIKIKDGDTIEILYNGSPLTIRLAHIDCPEVRSKQPYGKAAKQSASDLCFGDVVTVENESEFDRYDRLIGVVINSKGDTVNLELVKAGLAWHYKQYSSDTLYSLMEIRAKRNKVGLWADLNPVPPWDWR